MNDIETINKNESGEELSSEQIAKEIKLTRGALDAIKQKDNPPEHIQRAIKALEEGLEELEKMLADTQAK